MAPSVKHQKIRRKVRIWAVSGTCVTKITPMKVKPNHGECPLVVKKNASWVISSSPFWQFWKIISLVCCCCCLLHNKRCKSELISWIQKGIKSCYLKGTWINNKIDFTCTCKKEAITHPTIELCRPFCLSWANPPGEMEMQWAVIPPNPNPAGSPLTRVHTASHKYIHAHTQVRRPSNPKKLTEVMFRFNL